MTFGEFTKMGHAPAAFAGDRHGFQTPLTGTRAVGRPVALPLSDGIVVWKLIPIVHSHPRRRHDQDVCSAMTCGAGAVVSSAASRHHPAAAAAAAACYFTAGKTDVTAQCAVHCHRLLVKLLHSASSSLSQLSVSHHPFPFSTCLAGHIFISSLFSFSVIGLYTHFCSRVYSSSRRLQIHQFIHKRHI